MLYFDLIYTNMSFIYRICSYMVSAALTYLFGYSKNLVMAKNSMSQNDVRKL